MLGKQIVITLLGKSVPVNKNNNLEHDKQTSENQRNYNDRC